MSSRDDDKKKNTSTASISDIFNIEVLNKKPAKKNKETSQFSETVLYSNNPNEAESPEQKVKKMNDEQFWIFVRLSDIYLTEQFTSKQAQLDNERDRNEQLMDYLRELERIDIFFENLRLSDQTSLEKSRSDLLKADHLKSLETSIKQIEGRILILNSQIQQLNSVIGTMNTNIQQSINQRQTHVAKMANNLNSYADSNIPINNAKQASVPLLLTPNELKKSPPNWEGELKYDESILVRNVIRQAADKIISNEFSFIDQSNTIQNIVREDLRKEILNLISFLPINDREKCANRLMNSSEVEIAIRTLSSLTNEHVAARDSLNNNTMDSDTKILASMETEIKDQLTVRESFVNALNVRINQRDFLQEQLNIASQAKSEIKEHGTSNSMSTNDLSKLTNFDDIFAESDKEFETFIALQEKPSQEKTTSMSLRPGS